MSRFLFFVEQQQTEVNSRDVRRKIASIPAQKNVYSLLDFRPHTIQYFEHLL